MICFITFWKLTVLELTVVLEVFRKKKVVFRIGDTQMDKTQEVGPTKKEQILKVCLVKIKIKKIEIKDKV